MTIAAPNLYIDDTGAVVGNPIALWEGPVQSMSAQVVFGGTLAGTVTVEATNDGVAGKHPGDAVWVDVTSLLTMPTGSGMINFSFAAWAYLRISLSSPTGSGTVQVWTHVVRA